jgi:hypothetical protein
MAPGENLLMREKEEIQLRLLAQISALVSFFLEASRTFIFDFFSKTRQPKNLKTISA